MKLSIFIYPLLYSEFSDADYLAWSSTRLTNSVSFYV